ncbi:MAG: hypothetical protein R2932_39895 [Caldilineaceae bacterium]
MAGVDTEALPGLHGRRTVAEIVVDGNRSAQTGDLPRLAIGEQPSLSASG